MAMDRSAARIPAAARDAFSHSIDRAQEWVVGMQSENGGWGAFDADNEYYYLNEIPFADHGALLDPPTADVTARCVSMLAQLGASTGNNDALDKGIGYLVRTQEKDGSWYGRWGMNYVYGTWSVLCALNAARVQPSAPPIRRAVEWLLAIQNEDGGWGEAGDSYKLDYRGYEPAPSTASQTAWALLGLMAVGEVDHPSVPRGIKYLLQKPGRGRVLGRALFHRDRFPARLLSPLSRLREILPALGACPLPQSEIRQYHLSSGRDVSAASEHRGFVIAVCGLRAEARIAARSADARAVAGGGDAGRLGGLIQEQIARGGKAIISFGIAAGLAPGFDGGTCVVGSEVVSASDRKRYAVNRTWTGGVEVTARQGWSLLRSPASISPW